MKIRLKSVALPTILLIAFALRLYRLDVQDLWGDEAFSISLSQLPLPQVVAGGADTHPPFYPFLLFLALKIFGATIFATRALSAFVGVLAVPLINVFAKRVAASARVPWFAMVLAAVSPLFIYYSQETRMYELVAVLALASTYFALKCIIWLGGNGGAGEQGRFLSPALFLSRVFVRYFFVTLLAIYTHYSAFYVIAAQNLFAFAALWRNRRALMRWIVMQAALVVAYIPWFIVQTSFLQGKASARWNEFSIGGAEMIFGKTLLAFSIGLTLDPPIAWIASALFIALLGVGVYAIWRVGSRLAPVQSVQPQGSRFLTSLGTPNETHSKLSVMIREPQRWIAPIYFFIPVLIAFLVNPIFPFFFERYVLVALPGFYLTIALGLDYLAQREFRIAFGVTALLVFISLVSLTNYYFNDTYAKGKYGQMMAYVAANAQPSDALVLNNPLQKPLYNYYAPRGVPAFFLPDGTPLEDPRTRADLERIARAHPRIWLVMFGNPLEYDPTDYLKRAFGAYAFKTFTRGYVDASLTLYEMPRPVTVNIPVNATLDDSIRLVSFDLDRAENAPGQTVQLTLHWQTDASIAKNYVVFAHLLGEKNPVTQSPVWAQLDNEPVGGSRATTTWQIGETIDDRYGLQIPSDAPPGEYEIEVGMYDPGSGARVPVIDWRGQPVKENRVLLGVVRVR